MPGSSKKDKAPEQISMIMFLSRGTSLSKWEGLGILDREKVPISKLAEGLGQMTLLSYGLDEKTQGFDGIKVLYNNKGIPGIIYSMLIPCIHARELNAHALYNVYQLTGVLPAIVSKLLFRKKLYVRLGFLQSIYSKSVGTRMRYVQAVGLEWIATHMADIIVVTSDYAKKRIVDGYKVNPEKIKVIPNIINLEVFRPRPEIEKQRGRICFLGRLAKVKNLFSLIEAVAGLPVSLVFVGDGPLRKGLESHAQQFGVDLKVLGFVPNADAAAEICKSEIFAMPSFSEGNPKALLEAMACGVPVLSTDIPNLQEIINHGENGFLTRSDTASIRSCIIEILSLRDKWPEIGEKAIKTIKCNNDMDKNTKTELEHIYSAFDN